MGKCFLTRVPKPFNGERRSFPHMEWENWVSTCKRMKLYLYSTSHTKFNYKWIKDINIKGKTIKLIGKSTTVNLNYIR